LFIRVDYMPRPAASDLESGIIMQMLTIEALLVMNSNYPPGGFPSIDECQGSGSR
jgi:hypothetical protein